MMLLSALLKRLIKIGQLTVIDHAGRRHTFGGEPSPSVTIRLHDASIARQLAVSPKLMFGEGYMDGRLTVEGADIYAFLDIAALNIPAFANIPVIDALTHNVGRLIRRLHQYNPIGRAQNNVAHHYDLSDALYDLFLDKDRQYSCAYFSSDNTTLEAAQDNKKRHLAAKLLLKPGARVLDIGSGWGGLGIYLGRVGAGTVDGVTLSTEQHKVSNERARAAGLGDRVHFHLRDYRQQTGPYDRIVSVGMFEHVGVNHYREFFAKIRDLLADDGVAVLHSIGRYDGPGTTNAWIRKYIFPGGYSPALSEVIPAIEKERLIVTDVEILRLHYAKTIREWRRRFAANRERVKQLYDERFCRMWEFYLAGSEVAFRHQGHMNFQIQLAKRQDAIPLTRDYMVDWEREFSGRANLAV
jgi:cyclopropane-fatty-acyl-phospholipid synthase